MRVLWCAGAFYWNRAARERAPAGFVIEKNPLELFAKTGRKMNMAKNYDVLADRIVDLVGGKDNISVILIEPCA